MIQATRDIPDYDIMIVEAAKFVAPDIRVDMCRADDVDVTYWLFDSNDNQIGCTVFEPEHELEWRGTKMHRGMPYAQHRFETMRQAIRYASERNQK